MVPSRELGWGEVRNALQAMPEVRLVEAATASQALDEAAIEQPNVAIVASVLNDAPTTELVATLRRIVPAASNILIVGTHFGRAELLALAHAGASGYVLWGDLTLDILPQCLFTMVVGRFLLTSQSIGNGHADGRRWQPPVPTEEVEVSERQRRLLEHLDQGLTEKQIAAAEHVSQRTVRRLLVQVRTKLDAPTLFALGATTVRLRVLP
jgi:DNA-binding NarL/FixJ family response regulator